MNRLKKKKQPFRRSGTEERFEDYLRNQRIQYEYEKDRFKYKIPKVFTYTTDFTVLKRKTKEPIFFEVKGFFDNRDRQKILYVLKDNPGIDLRLIFERDNKINKKSMTRYSNWAEKHGIKYHIGVGLPPEWIKEIQEK